MSRYTVYVIPQAWLEMKNLPGHMRQRVKQAIEELSDNPRPSNSKELEAADLEGELRRLRLDRWRVVYAITEIDNVVDVLAVRKRPPYDYGDLKELLEQAQ
ncbi:MAG: type II toxin-antitoxin system RelE/ParE family toxin [Anaerolineae bacterium]|nr:type II toxin-antitoxin system RelE/ParE family toxin [Anaerolineales bacterium]MCQ3973225.1 type II toxin-antitoxin system RelE/ParE family toxin [Anaerolineae bacterium]